jgi:hypothetical protein
MTLILRTVRTARNPAMHSEACHDPLAGASSRRIPMAHARTSVGRGKGLKAGGLTRRAIILRTNNLHIVSMAQLDCGLVTTKGTGVEREPGENGGSLRGFGAGQGMVSGVGSGRRALKGPGIPPPLSGSSLQISRLRRSLPRPPLSLLSISLYLCLRARLGGVRLGPGGLGVGRSISGHQLSLAPRPGLGADRRIR